MKISGLYKDLDKKVTYIKIKAPIKFKKNSGGIIEGWISVWIIKENQRFEFVTISKEKGGKNE